MLKLFAQLIGDSSRTIGARRMRAALAPAVGARHSVIVGTTADNRHVGQRHVDRHEIDGTTTKYSGGGQQSGGDRQRAGRTEFRCDVRIRQCMKALVGRGYGTSSLTEACSAARATPLGAFDVQAASIPRTVLVFGEAWFIRVVRSASSTRLLSGPLSVTKMLEHTRKAFWA